MKTNLYDLEPATLATVLGDSGPRFRAEQVSQWLYQKHVDHFGEMTNLPREMREDLDRRFTLDRPAIREVTEPADDGTRKYLLALADQSLIEAVAMPTGKRTTFCISSQAGCAVGCTFCVTGFFGAGRNLTPAEIVGQVHVLQREMDVPSEKLNLVFMGMGEPLLNLDHLRTALEILGRTIPSRRITISTAGIIPGLDALAKFEPLPNLAISVNAPDQTRREQIMPITRKYPLDELMEAVRRFPLEHRREVTVEYVLLAGWNDAPRDAEMLARLVRGARVLINAIPFNPDPRLPSWMKRPGDDAIDRFAAVIAHHGVPITVRRSKGLGIAAACGQLRGREELPRRPVLAAKRPTRMAKPGEPHR